MLTGIEFQPPRTLAMRLSFEVFKAVHAGLYGQILVMRLFKDKGILTQICGNNFNGVEVEPSLTVSEEQMACCLETIWSVIRAVHTSDTFWADALSLGRRPCLPG